MTNPARADTVLSSLSTVLAELLDGAADAGWVLNPHDDGLLRSLDRLSAEAASAIAPGGAASIAAHVDHLCYGLELLHRWSAGDHKVFETADYAASWRRTTVTDAEWAALRARLRDQAHRWRRAMAAHADADAVAMNGIVGSVVHLAYHLGAIRQIDRATRGPSADD